MRRRYFLLNPVVLFSNGKQIRWDKWLNLLVRSLSFGGGIINLHFFIGFIFVQMDVRLVDADDGLVEQAVSLLHVLRHDLKKCIRCSKNSTLKIRRF